MLPEHLKVDFWAKVLQFLRERHSVDEERARQGIAEYREYVEQPRVGDMVYHRDPDAVADTIAGILRQGGVRTLEPQGAGETPE